MLVASIALVALRSPLHRRGEAARVGGDALLLSKLLHKHFTLSMQKVYANPFCIKFMLQREEKGVENMLNKQDIEALDAAIRASLVARQEELRMTDEALGTVAFGYLKAPRGKVQSLFVGQGDPDRRKPQVIKIGELVNLCEAMGLPWADVIKSALKALPR